MASPDPTLLNGNADSTWQNLGDWSSATAYPDAARTLAVGLGQRLELGPSDRIVDVGCGMGDQLRLWHSAFNVPSVLGLEPAVASVACASERVADLDGASVEANDDRALAGRAATVVVSLDAAYHFASRRTFLERAAATLPSGGRLGLTDLFIPTAPPTARARLFAIAAGIPRANLWTHSQWRATLTDTGFELMEWTDLTESVLGGFGRWGIHAARGFWRRPRLGWLMIAGTALAATDAAKRGWLGYSRIIARRL